MAAQGRRLTVQERIAARNRGNAHVGTQEGWADEALEYYLDGIPVNEICECFDVSKGSFYNSIAKAALYRLMLQRNAELLEDMPELHSET